MQMHGWLLALSGLLAACSGVTGADPTSGSNEPTGTARERAQFANDTLVNLVDPGKDPALLITAASIPETVEVFYLSAKTTDTGSDPGTVTLAETINLAADQTARHEVDMRSAAFADGYGAILVNSSTNVSSSAFQTYVQYGGSMFSTGGSVFMGSSYRIPFWSGTLRMVLAITNQSDFTFNVQLSNVGTAMVKTITLPPLSTFRFDSTAAGWTLSGTNSVQILTTSGGTISLSGYLDRVPHRIRITPVKAAPFF